MSVCAKIVRRRRQPLNSSVRALLKRRTKIILISALTLPFAGLGALEVADRSENPGRVAYMLNIPLPPESLRVSVCESGPWTDVVITCAIEINPTEFPLLLRGYAFSNAQSNESSHSLGGGIPKVGPEFTVATQYSVEPASFKNGGMVRVFADAENRHAIVDLYIE